MRKFITTLAIAAGLAGAIGVAAPAEAQPGYGHQGRYDGRGWDRGHDRGRHYGHDRRRHRHGHHRGWRGHRGYDRHHR